jgi:hypothetical protein
LTKATETIIVEDYYLLMAGNDSLLAELNDFRYHCEDLERKLTEVHFDAKKGITDLEAKVKFAKAHSIDVAATGERQLRDFEGRLVRDL